MGRKKKVKLEIREVKSVFSFKDLSPIPLKGIKAGDKFLEFETFVGWSGAWIALEDASDTECRAKFADREAIFRIIS